VKLKGVEVMAVVVPVVLWATGAPVPVPLLNKLNWSAAAIRPVEPSAFCRLSVGAFFLLVTVQMMASPATGVTLIGMVVKPLTLVVPPVLVQVTAWLYSDSAEVLPLAMASFKM